ncbi:Uma2 family endonuclease [Bernardetia sp. OM2101]|uniref:Uma2 family endonuclease n=1 Tax=Bernardetia sp. OM2101 TaxID=3344876 RepID=UPI0035D1288A
MFTLICKCLLNHARIAKNITSKIDAILEKGGDKCEIFGSDAKLAIEVKNNYVYPDAMIVCGDVEDSKHQNHALTNPKIIIEVLSKSTKGYDKDGKFLLYMLVPSLEYYVLIEQEEPKIHIYHKMKTESTQNEKDATKSLWQIETLTGIDKMLSFPTLDIYVPFTDIYRKVAFENL